MASEGVSNSVTTEVKDQNDVRADQASEELSSLNKNATPEKRGRGRGGSKRKSDSDMMAEAKAVLGDISPSEGRQLRKRAEPPKVEKKTTPVRKASTRKSSTPNSKKAKLDASDSEEKADEEEQKEDAKVDVNDGKTAGETEALNNGTAVESIASEEENKDEKSDAKESEIPVQHSPEAEKAVPNSAE